MVGTIYRREWIRFRPSMVYFLLSCFMLTLLGHLFLGFPLRSVFKDIGGMNYMFWMVPGIIIILSSLMAYSVTLTNMNNLLAFPKSIDIVCKTPVANWQVLAGLVCWGSTIGIIQWILSLAITSILNNEFYQLLINIRLAVQTIIIIPFFAVLAIFTHLISNNRFWILTSSLFYFISLSFGFGCLIPLNVFPGEVVELVRLIPLTGIVEGAQSIIMGRQGSFIGGLFTLIFTGIIFIFSVIFSNKKFRQ